MSDDDGNFTSEELGDSEEFYGEMSKLALGDANSITKKGRTMAPNAPGDKAATAVFKRSETIAASRRLMQKNLPKPSLNILDEEIDPVDTCKSGPHKASNRPTNTNHVSIIFLDSAVKVDYVKMVKMNINELNHIRPGEWYNIP